MWGLSDNNADGAEGTIPYIYILIFVFLFWSGEFRGVYSFCTVSNRVCRMSSIYKNKVDSRLHEFGKILLC